MVKHPADWCAKRCGIPLDPVLIVMGRSMHPSCEFPELAVSKTPESNVCSDSMESQIQSGAGPVLLAPCGPTPNRSERSG